MKGDTEVVVRILSFVGGFAFATLFVGQRTTIPLGDVVNPLATLIAAFVGAWAAFRLQTIHRHEEEKKNHIVAGNRALSTLMQQANTLKLFQLDFVAPFRTDPGRHIAMQPLLPYQEDALSFDFRSLDFLAQPDQQQTLFELSVEENRFREALKAINARSRLHFEVIQPLLMSAGIQEGREYTEDQFLAAVGNFHYLHLKRLTDAVVMHVDRTVESLCSMKDRLRTTLSEAYPDGRFIDFQLLDEGEQAPRVLP